MTVTLYHNPRCSKSRAALALLEDRGIQPRIVKYLETPPDAATLRNVLHALGLGARDLIRTGEAAYGELGLDDPALTEAELVDAMTRHPQLIERPILVNGKRARIGRPPERILEILD